MNGERRKDCCTKDRLCGLSMFLSVSLLFSLVCLAVFSYFLFMRPKESDYCTDPQCIASAAEINEFIDEQVEPCEDFHAFVCDKFMTVAYEKQMNSPYSAEKDRVESKIDKYIIEPESRDDEQPVTMQKKFFRACLDEEAIDDNNNTDFRSLLNDIGGLPLLNRDEWKEQDFDWIKTMVKARRLGLPFDWFLDIDIHDSDDKYYLKIARPKSCGNFDGSLLYQDVILHIIRDLVPKFTSATKVFEIINFESNLSQICTKMKTEQLTRATVDDLERNKDKIWPENMNFPLFIQTITNGQIRNWQKNTEIFYDRYYISEIKKLLNRTDKEIQANYIAWKISQNFAPYLAKSIREAYQQYTDEYEDRFQFCLKDTKSRFNLVSDVMYIRENAPPEIVKAVQELVTSIKNEFSEQIKNIEWMSNETKVVHLNSYENLNITIGGPETIFDKNFFRRYLDVAKLSFSSDNIIRMLCDWSTNIFLVKMSRINRPSTLPFNSEYIESRDLLFDKKQLYLPAHMLHGPTFELNRPYYLNYASLGTLIARTLIEDNVPRNTLSNDYHNYMKNLQCLHRGIKTSNYDRNTQFLIAETNYIDLFSRHIAYSAYQKYVEDNEEELELAGVNYSPNELFWIKSTMNLCYKRLPNKDDIFPMWQEAKGNSILQSVKNSPFFGEDFGCEEDAPMNPADKCSIY